MPGVIRAHFVHLVVFFPVRLVVFLPARLVVFFPVHFVGFFSVRHFVCFTVRIVAFSHVHVVASFSVVHVVFFFHVNFVVAGSRHAATPRDSEDTTWTRQVGTGLADAVFLCSCLR